MEPITDPIIQNIKINHKSLEDEKIDIISHEANKVTLQCQGDLGSLPEFLILLFLQGQAEPLVEQIIEPKVEDEHLVINVDLTNQGYALKFAISVQLKT